MSTPETSLPDEDRILTREEGFALMDTMVGTWHDMFERVGGVEKFLRELRDED